MIHQISTRIEHLPGDMEFPAFARLVMFVDGVRINYQDFSTNHPTAEEVSRARWYLAYQLYFNPIYSQYQKSLYSLAFPYGE